MTSKALPNRRLPTCFSDRFFRFWRSFNQASWQLWLMLPTWNLLCRIWGKITAAGICVGQTWVWPANQSFCPFVIMPEHIMYSKCTLSMHQTLADKDLWSDYSEKPKHWNEHNALQVAEHWLNHEEGTKDLKLSETAEQPWRLATFVKSFSTCLYGFAG